MTILLYFKEHFIFLEYFQRDFLKFKHEVDKCLCNTEALSKTKIYMTYTRRHDNCTFAVIIYDKTYFHIVILLGTLNVYKYTTIS